jgi:hypothetical protein
MRGGCHPIQRNYALVQISIKERNSWLVSCTGRVEFKIELNWNCLGPTNAASILPTGNTWVCLKMMYPRMPWFDHHVHRYINSKIIWVLHVLRPFSVATIRRPGGATIMGFWGSNPPWKGALATIWSFSALLPRWTVLHWSIARKGLEANQVGPWRSRKRKNRFEQLWRRNQPSAHIRPFCPHFSVRSKTTRPTCLTSWPTNLRFFDTCLCFDGE